MVIVILDMIRSFHHQSLWLSIQVGGWFWTLIMTILYIYIINISIYVFFNVKDVNIYIYTILFLHPPWCLQPNFSILQNSGGIFVCFVSQQTSVSRRRRRPAWLHHLQALKRRRVAVAMWLFTPLADRMTSIHLKGHMRPRKPWDGWRVFVACSNRLGPSETPYLIGGRWYINYIITQGEIPLIYRLIVLANWVIIRHLPPIKGTRFHSID